MEDWRKLQEDLRLDMEKEKTTNESQLRTEKYDFDKRRGEMEKTKDSKKQEVH